MDMTQIFGSQVTKLSQYSKVFLTQGNSFWCKENSSVLAEDSHQMEVEIPATPNCLMLVLAASPPEAKRRFQRSWMCYPANSIPSFHTGMCLLWKLLKFQACCCNNCATLQEKLKTSNQDFWKSILQIPSSSLWDFLERNCV